MTIEIRQEDEGQRGRYRLLVDDADAGEVTYRMQDGNRVFVHTEVHEDFEGQGLAGKLAEHVLDAARREGILIVPQCPYIRGYIERHPEYQDLVATPS
ncbi:GNAT family N-acetyltransferase [Aquihabitans sp. McL0605]|uniref:GNAT family N-acetyltransferase n=1 Tax=Aquihabitans sp. McL0605 TaxID=3415671 RepID=UPI003CEC6DDC